MSHFGSQFSALASYKNNALITVLPHTADLKLLMPLSGEPEKDTVQEVLGLQVHEYIHQLHNFSTTAGIQLLKNRLVALQIFATGTNDDGHYVRQGKIYKGIDKSVLENFERDYSRILGDTGKIEREGFLADFSFEVNEICEETDDPTDLCNILGVTVSYKIGGIPEKTVIDNVGYNIITEGIAYEIEMHVRNTITGGSGMGLVYSTPPLPYRLYRPIVEHLVGRRCSLPELVKIGTLALQNTIPSWGLKAATAALKHSDELFEQFTASMAKEHQEVMEGYNKTISQLLDSVFVGTSVSDGMKMLDGIVRCAFNKRAEDPFFELLFIQEPLTLQAFSDIIQGGNLPPRCIIQNKFDEGAEYYWMGNGVANLPEATFGAISTLQAAIQYSHLHLSQKASFNNTSELVNSPHELSCPYLKVCPLKDARKNPELCSTTPWMHDLGIQSGDVCWYVNGVKSVRNLSYRDYDEEYA